MKAFACAILALCIVATGCVFKPDLGTAQAGWGRVLRSDDRGDAFTLGVGAGLGEEPALGPLFFTGVLALRQLEGDADEYRLGFRGQSSMLDRATASYPYASMMVYLGWYDPPAGGYFGLGAEGAFGMRFGLGANAAIDLELAGSYGRFEGGRNLWDSMLGASVAFIW